MPGTAEASGVRDPGKSRFTSRTILYFAAAAINPGPIWLGVEGGRGAAAEEPPRAREPLPDPPGFF